MRLDAIVLVLSIKLAVTVCSLCVATLRCWSRRRYSSNTISLLVWMWSLVLDRVIWRTTWTDINNHETTKTPSSITITITTLIGNTSWTKCPRTWGIKCTVQQVGMGRLPCTHTWTITIIQFQIIIWCTLNNTTAIEASSILVDTYSIYQLYIPLSLSWTKIIYVNMINDHFCAGRTLLIFLWFRSSSYLLSSSSSRSLCCLSRFFLSSACCKLKLSVAFSILNILWCFSVSSWVLCLACSIVCWSNMLFVVLVFYFIWFFSLICSSRYYFCSFWYYLVLSWWGWSSPSKNVNPELSWVWWRVGLGLK